MVSISSLARKLRANTVPGKQPGFTLIEVLIVVVIMAVLAATILPQFGSSTEDAKNSQVDYNLRILQAQIELYRAHHLGRYPAITGNLRALTERTNLDGTATGTPSIGPYVLEIPVNSHTGVATVSASTTGTERTGGGWLYDATTGHIWADDIATTEEEEN